MPINLTTQESRPTITQARLRRLGADVIGRTLVVDVAFGYLSGGNFITVREQRFTYDDNSSPSFNQALGQAPALLTARDQIETYYSSTIVPGTIV